jgi:hypothetical protein
LSRFLSHSRCRIEEEPVKTFLSKWITTAENRKKKTLIHKGFLIRSMGLARFHTDTEMG